MGEDATQRRDGGKGVRPMKAIAGTDTVSVAKAVGTRHATPPSNVTLCGPSYCGGTAQRCTGNAHWREGPSSVTARSGRLERRLAFDSSGICFVRHLSRSGVLLSNDALFMTKVRVVRKYYSESLIH